MKPFEWLRRVCGCSLSQQQEQAFNLSDFHPRGTSEVLDDWGTNANCYAYAVNHPTPLNAVAGAVPGGASGSPALLSETGDYPRQLVFAARADGLISAEGSPGSPPDDIPGYYLTALIANNAGFHWLRREPSTRFWSWKDGNSGAVRLNVFNVREDRFVYIDDTNLAELLVNGGNFAPWFYSQMHFVSFFRVPASGVAAAGLARPR